MRRNNIAAGLVHDEVDRPGVVLERDPVDGAEVVDVVPLSGPFQLVATPSAIASPTGAGPFGRRRRPGGGPGRPRS